MIIFIHAVLFLLTAMMLDGCYPDRPIPQPVMTAGLPPQESVAQPTDPTFIHRPVQ